MKWRLFALLIVCVILGVTFFSCDPSPKKPEKLYNLIILTVDTTRADHIGCYGNTQVQTPALDQLAKEGTRFANANSHIPLTLPSHSTIFTGNYPIGTGVHDNIGFRLSEDVTTLAEYLKGNGYHTGAFIAAKVLVSKFGINQGFEEFNEKIPPKKPSRNAEAVFKPAKEWIEKQKGHPFFSWIHLYDPHLPYEHPEPFWSQYAANPYAGEISYMDSQIQLFLNFLKEQNLYDSSLIMVVADHGESLGEHKETTHGYFPYEATTHIPFILKPMAHIKTKSVIEDRVRLIDVMPTSLAMLGFSIPKTVQGADLTPLLYSQKESLDLVSYSEAFLPFYKYNFSPIRVLRTNRYKLVDDCHLKELYDLQADPNELKNLREEKPDIVKELEIKLKLLRETYSTREDSLFTPDEKTLLSLASLGYVNHPIRPIKEGQESPSSIENIDQHDRLIRAGSCIGKQEYPEAEKLLFLALGAFPDMPSVHENLAILYFKQNQFEKTLQYLNKLLSFNPNDTISMQKMAMCYYGLKDAKKSVEMLREIIKISPSYEEARENLWKLYLNAKRVDLLKTELHEFMQQNPNSEFGWMWEGRFARDDKQWDKAISAFQKCLTNEDFSALAWFEIGKILREKQNLPEARKAFEKSIEFNDQDINVVVNFAVILIQDKEFDTALAHLQRALKLHPSPIQMEELSKYLVNVYLEISRKYLESQPQKSLEALSGALLYAPKNYLILEQLIQLEIILEKKEEAYNHILQAISYEFLGMQHLKILNLLERVGKAPEAFNYLLQFLQNHPEEKYGYLYLGELAIKLQLRQQAIDGFSKFLELYQEQDATRDQIVNALEKLKGLAPNKEK
ncbi:MAG: sulfatase-like hydrolase/transferase [Planctomycetota bacterium]